MGLSKQKSREALESAQLDCAVWGRWCFGPGYGGGKEGSYAGRGSTSSLDIISKLFVGRELPCGEGALRRSIQMVSISSTVNAYGVGVVVDDTGEKVDIPKPAITRSGINHAGTANRVASDDELVGGFITFQCRKSGAAVGQHPVPAASQSGFSHRKDAATRVSPSRKKHTRVYEVTRGEKAVRGIRELGPGGKLTHDVTLQIRFLDPITVCRPVEGVVSFIQPHYPDNRRASSISTQLAGRPIQKCLDAGAPCPPTKTHLDRVLGSWLGRAFSDQDLPLQ
ncbi:hypothetical protein EDD15DRAFT_2201265 [Pisolithus albus]|nr:hypothetical protein EDD15DRAFT_2201265 [Pisolithus albus]